jgi:hypothetical protein
MDNGAAVRLEFRAPSFRIAAPVRPSLIKQNFSYIFRSNGADATDSQAMTRGQGITCGLPWFLSITPTFVASGGSCIYYQEEGGRSCLVF